MLEADVQAAKETVTQVLNLKMQVFRSDTKNARAVATQLGDAVTVVGAVWLSTAGCPIFCRASVFQGVSDTLYVV